RVILIELDDVLCTRGGGRVGFSGEGGARIHPLNVSPPTAGCSVRPRAAALRRGHSVAPARRTLRALEQLVGLHEVVLRLLCVSLGERRLRQAVPRGPHGWPGSGGPPPMRQLRSAGARYGWIGAKRRSNRPSPATTGRRRRWSSVLRRSDTRARSAPAARRCAHPRRPAA